ncbi:PAS domain-containing protein cky-1-like isoform X2 [Ornithodoros turicata]|uniref:PAS domain-containing protein cky-1-like isoform X2 n=1 Tax=Ornithodoros turicata TaxID=34597 RepID=UPI00313906A3
MSSMLANGPNILQMCSFEANKSTKGASKLRRDLINAEIANLRDLLPLPSSTRQRLSQLQLMALVCVYVRKANYFQHVFRKHEIMPEVPMLHFGFSKAMSGFLMMMTQNGKLLYISDNAAEYLGHSMDLLIHGDSVYDIIEKQDHQAIQAELMRSPSPMAVLGPQADTRLFLCRMNVSRNARRQMRFGDQKVVLVQGHYVSFLPLCSRNEPVFLATCTPVAMPETRECVVQGSTSVFTSIHGMDMKFLHIDRNGEFHLGYQKSSLQSISWYELVHWEHLREAQSKHRLITQSEQERSCILLVRLQARRGNWIWVHVVLQVKDASDSSQQPVIVCTNQVLSDREATVMRANGWLYQYYSLHSKMHYGLTPYEATPAPRLPAYYPALMPYPPSRGDQPSAIPQPHSPYPLHPGSLNGSPGQHHPGVLQYGGPHGAPLPYTSIAASPPCSSPDRSSSKWSQQSAGIKRSMSPQAQDRVKVLRPNGAFTELGPVVSTGYYGAQVLTAGPIPTALRGPTKLTFDEDRLTDVEQSLTPTNTEDVSQLISSGYHSLRPAYMTLDEHSDPKTLATVYPPVLEAPPPPYYPRYLEFRLDLGKKDVGYGGPCMDHHLREDFLYHRGILAAPSRPGLMDDVIRGEDARREEVASYWRGTSVGSSLVNNGGGQESGTTCQTGVQTTEEPSES